MLYCALVLRQIARKLSAGQPDHLLQVGAPQPHSGIVAAGEDLRAVGRESRCPRLRCRWAGRRLEVLHAFLRRPGACQARAGQRDQILKSQ